MQAIIISSKSLPHNQWRQRLTRHIGGRLRPRARRGWRAAPECWGGWDLGRGTVAPPQHGDWRHRSGKILNCNSKICALLCILGQPLRQIICTASTLFTMMKTTMTNFGGYKIFRPRPGWPNIAGMRPRRPRWHWRPCAQVTYGNIWIGITMWLRQENLANLPCQITLGVEYSLKGVICSCNVRFSYVFGNIRLQHSIATLVIWRRKRTGFSDGCESHSETLTIHTRFVWLLCVRFCVGCQHRWGYAISNSLPAWLITGIGVK